MLSQPICEKFIEGFFERNPPIHLDWTHQTTRFCADQTIQFARAVDFEVSLASFGMLQELLFKTNLIGRGGGGRMASSGSAFSGRAGTSDGDCVASHCLYSLPTITESMKSEQVDMGSQEPRSSRQVDEALSSVSVVYWKSRTHCLKTLQDI